MRWRDQANCLGQDLTEFFPETNVEDEFVTDRVREICGACQVWEHCLGTALETRAVGIWAATTTIDRRRIRQAQVPEHGTRGRFMREIKEGQTPCELCRQANRDYQTKHRRAAMLRTPVSVGASNVA